MKNDLTDRVIGVFKVIEDSGKRRIPSKNILWKVKCNLCNNEKLLTLREIQKNKSCGCISRKLQGMSLRASLNKGGYEEIYASHWNILKESARKRDLEFLITSKYAWELFLKQNRKCALTGVSIYFPTKCWNRDATASLDRINSSLGYTEGNVQWVHKNINFMKQQYSDEIFINWCKKVVEHNKL